MSKPALVVVHDDREMLAALEQTLLQRFGTDYQIAALETPAEALDVLGRSSVADEQVAVLLANQRLPGMTGVQFLSRAHAVHPAAKRVLLIPYGDVAAGVAGLQAMALGQLDHWLNTPVGPPELQLYPTLGELLSQWAKPPSAPGRSQSGSGW
jgi:thioredoxin reductase (NADPH)